MADVNSDASPDADRHVVYKILRPSEWAAFRQSTVFKGSPVDLVDGYIHLSTAAQTPETAAKHFGDEPEVILLSMEATSFGQALRWEPSRGGALFPHLYAELPISAVRRSWRIAKGADGRHAFPLELGA